jgi:hypothetical protein
MVQPRPSYLTLSCADTRKTSTHFVTQRVMEPTLHIFHPMEDLQGEFCGYENDKRQRVQLPPSSD